MTSNTAQKNHLRVSSHHKNHQALHAELEAAKSKVKIGAIYAHYKFPENHYRVIGLGFREASDELCVIYEAVYDPGLVFIRELNSWLETPKHNGKLVTRFKQVID